jgi:hypothetical protein
MAETLLNSCAECLFNTEIYNLAYAFGWHSLKSSSDLCIVKPQLRGEVLHLSLPKRAKC